MSMTKVVEVQRNEWVRSARLLGENLSRRAFGERGPDWNVTLADLEQFLRPLIVARAGGRILGGVGERADAAVGGDVAVSHLRAGVFAEGA